MTGEQLETQPVCIGKYVAHVPIILKPSMTLVKLDGFDIENLGSGNQEALDAKITERRALMEAGATMDQNSLPTRYLYGRYGQGVTILAYERPPTDDYFPENAQDDIEAYFLSHGNLFRISGQINKDDRESQLAGLFYMAHATTPRSNEDVPQGPGYCVEKAFVSSNKELDSYTAMSLTNGDADADFNFNIVIIHSTDLAARQYDWPDEATRRVVAGVTGMQAWGAMDQDYPGRRGYAGEFYAFVPPQGRAQGLEINMRISRFSKSPEESEFSLNVANQFWNTVLNSLRLK